MVAAAVRGCGCLKAPMCPGTAVQVMSFGAGQEDCEPPGQQGWVSSVCRVFKTAVVNCLYSGNEQLACSGTGKHWPCPFIPKGEEESSACVELAEEGPGQQVGKALWVNLSQCYLPGADPAHSMCLGAACFTLWVSLQSWIGPAEWSS